MNRHLNPANCKSNHGSNTYLQKQNDPANLRLGEHCRQVGWPRSSEQRACCVVSCHGNYIACNHLPPSNSPGTNHATTSQFNNVNLFAYFFKQTNATEKPM